MGLASSKPRLTSSGPEYKPCNAALSKNRRIKARPFKQMCKSTYVWSRQIPESNAFDSITERSDLQDSEGIETSSDTARLTVHEDDVEFYWPLAYSMCCPVWHAACVSNTPFYPYPLVCSIEEARAVFKNMIFEAQKLPTHIVAIDVRKKQPVVEKTKSESTQSFTEVPVQEGYFTDNEMNSALLLLEHQFGGSKRAALRIAEALNHGKIALRKLRAYLGEEAASNFLRTITKPHWLMTLLANALGSMKSALHCVDVYRKSEVGSSEHKEASARLIEIAGNENFVKAFAQKFTALREIVANGLTAQLKLRADEVDKIIVECLGGANIPMRRIESLTGAKVEVIQGLLNALKRCNEEEVETYLQILTDCIAGKLKSDEETAERLARIQKHKTELEHKIQKHQQGLEEYRYRRKSPIIITIPTKEQPLHAIDAKPPEIILSRQEKPKGKKRRTKAATVNAKVIREDSKEAKEAEEEVEVQSMEEEEIIIPFLDFTALDETASQFTLIDEAPQRSLSFTAGSVLSMEGVDLEEETLVRDRQFLDEPSQLPVRKVAKSESSEVSTGTDELLDLPAKTYIVNEIPGEINDVLLQEDIRLMDTRLSKRVWDLKRAVGCEGFLEPDIGLEPNRILLVLVRSAIDAEANQLVEMIEQVQTLLKQFLILGSVKETVRYMLGLLFQKIATKLRNGEHDTGEKAIYLEVGGRIIKQLKQLGVNTHPYASNLQASVMQKPILDAVVERQDLFLKTPVVPYIDLGELLKTIKGVSWKSLSSFGQITPTIHFTIKEALEETESTYSMAAPSSSNEKKGLSSSSSTASIAISVDLPLTEKQLTITEGDLSAETSDSEAVWLPNTSRGIISTSTAVGSQYVDFETFDEVAEDLLAKRLYESYGGEVQGSRKSLIRMAQEMIENPTVFDVVEMRSSKSFDLENLDETELELAVAKVIQKMEDEEAAARLTRVVTPEIEEVETLEMRLAKVRALLSQRRSHTAEEESHKEREIVSLTPALPPYPAVVVKYQLQDIIEELQMSQNNQQDLNTLERILWLTLPENVADRYELFVRVADLQRRGQFSGKALKALLESVLIDVTDLLTLLDPEFEIEDEQRYSIYDQLRTNLDVLCWFKLNIDEYEEQLREYPELMQFGGTLFPRKFEHPILLKNTETKLSLPQSYLHYIPQSLAKVVDVETPLPWHMVTFQGAEIDLNLGSVDAEEENVEMPSETSNKTIQFSPLADLLTEGIKKSMHEKNFEGELYDELPPTQKQTKKLAAYMNWRRNKLEMAGTTARCLFSIAPEIVDQDRNVLLEVVKLIDVQALSTEVATLFVSSVLQDLPDLTLVALNKDDFQKDERQMAYNQCRAMIEVLQCFKVPIKEFESNFDYCTDLEDQYKTIFTDGEFPTIRDDCDFSVDLPQAYIHELPFEVLEAVGDRLRIEETSREPLKSYLKHIDAQAFANQDKYDFERTRALAVHALRLHSQDVNGIIKHEIEMLEEQKRRIQEESKSTEKAATDIDRIIDRWLGFRASADQAPATPSPEIGGISAANLELESDSKKESGKLETYDFAIQIPKGLSEEDLKEAHFGRDETLEEVSSIEIGKPLLEDSKKVVHTIELPSAEVLPQETEFDGGQQKETSTIVYPSSDESTLIRSKEAEGERPKMKKLDTNCIPIVQQQYLESISEELSRVPPDSIMPSEETDSLSKNIVKLLEKNKELELQREKFAQHLAAVEAAKKALSVIYERQEDASATAKRKAYDQTSKLRWEEEQHLQKRFQLSESGGSVIATSKSVRAKESLKMVSKMSTKTPVGRKKKKSIKRKPAIKRELQTQPPSLPSMNLHPLEFNMTTTIGKNLPPVMHRFAELENIYSVSPLSPPPSPPPSGRTKLPPLWPDQQKRWRSKFLYDSEFEEVNMPKIEVITPTDMAIKNIQPLRPVRARKHYVNEGKVIQFPRPTTIASEKLDSALMEQQLRKSPWPKDSHMEANHRFITNELRINLILKKLRMQLNTHDLVEVMIDLHTGRASKRTREIVRTAYETIEGQKYTHLSDEAAEKCRPQCRPNDVSSAEWKRIGTDVRSAHPFDERSFPGYFIADSIGDGGRAHCEQEKMARLGAFSNGLTFCRISRRANIIGRVRTYVQERSYLRIKKSLEDCIELFNSRMGNEELQ
ncbi:hypothetical protein TcWFU_001824 [Taenia crassiceps]|uniref:Uncharacterized protein n=1 Tax=Taenia crassiceps TaxID=6207 RepID=A0ABR4QAF0_9CEST